MTRAGSGRGPIRTDEDIPGEAGSINDGWEYREQVGADAAGLTALAYLCVRYQHSDEPEWRARLDRGEVCIDGRVAAAGDPLRPGDELLWRRPPWLEPAVPLTFDVIFEDDDLLVVSKPSGLQTAPAGIFLEHTLLSLVRHRDPAWTPMHRLGRGTTGLVVFARTAEARTRLAAAWRGREVEKRYLALATGAVPPRLVITAPIGPVTHPVLGTIHAATPTGRDARSEAMLVAPRGDDSLVEVHITTGRPHQIRIHMAFAGHPLVGDPLYGPGGVPIAGGSALPSDLGYLLHAWILSFAHPRTGARVTFDAPLPDALGWARTIVEQRRAGH